MGGVASSRRSDSIVNVGKRVPMGERIEICSWICAQNSPDSTVHRSKHCISIRKWEIWKVHSHGTETLFITLLRQEKNEKG
jgi:hypothetical protein